MLKGKDLLSIHDLSLDEFHEILALAKELKAMQKAGVQHHILEGKTLGMIFEKSSTRTRVSFETGMYQLGGQALFLSNRDLQLGRGEPIKDTARVLSRYLDGIMIRTFGHDRVEELAKYSDVPVWNGLTNEFHPTQMLADMLTIREHRGDLKGQKLVYMGDARYNMADSYMVVCAKLGMHFVACAPKAYWPNAELIATCQAVAAETGATLSFTESVPEACQDADVICTDVWVSMGEPDEVWAQRIHDLKPYQVNADAFRYAKDDAIFLHCLPAFHDTNTKIGKQIYEKYGLTEMEVSNEIFEGPHSVVFDEAENRMHTIKAVVYTTLGGK